MNWILRNLGVLIATVAVGLSLTTVILNRRQRRQDMYLRVLETLIDPQLRRGRQLLKDCGESGLLPPEGSDDFALLSHTLSVHNTIAIYVRRRIVPKRWLLEGWRNTLASIRPATELYIGYRRNTYGWDIFDDLVSLINSAEKAVVKRRGPDRQDQVVITHRRDPANAHMTDGGHPPPSETDIQA